MESSTSASPEKLKLLAKKFARKDPNNLNCNTIETNKKDRCTSLSFCAQLHEIPYEKTYKTHIYSFVTTYGITYQATQEIGQYKTLNVEKERIEN